MKKKVLFVLQKISDGGAERVATVLCNELCKMDLDVTLLVYFPTKGEYPVNSQIKKIYLKKTEPEYRSLSFFQKLKDIRDVLKKERADYFVPFLYFVGVHVQLASIGLHGKVIQTVRNDPKSVPQSRKERLIRDVIYCFMWKGFVQNKRQLEYFPSYIRKKMTILPNPVSEEFLKNNPTRENNGLIVSVGRLNEQKNFEMLIRVARILKCKNYRFQIEIYGEGSLRETLQKQIIEYKVEDCCKLCGRTEDVPAVLSKASVFVMTSSYEGMPNALMEAMASGLPCVSTNCPTGPNELIVDGVNGYLIEINDDEKCAQRIIQILSDRDVSLSIGEHARQSIMGNYSPSVIAKRFREEVLMLSNRYS